MKLHLSSELGWFVGESSSPTRIKFLISTLLNPHFAFDTCKKLPINTRCFYFILSSLTITWNWDSFWNSAALWLCICLFWLYFTFNMYLYMFEPSICLAASIIIFIIHRYMSNFMNHVVLSSHCLYHRSSQTSYDLILVIPETYRRLKLKFGHNVQNITS